MHRPKPIGILTSLTLALSIPSFGDEPAASQPDAHDGTATVTNSAIEKHGDDLFFRVTVQWPRQGIPADFSDFIRKPGQRWLYHAYPWPPDALALIPQTPEAFSVFRRDQTGEAPAGEQVFLGKLRTAGKYDFLLRCPTPNAKWQYLPVSVDFTAAAKQDGLAKEWTKAELAFVTQFPAPPDQSFFAYARELLQARLSPSERPATPPPNLGFGVSGQDRLYEITTGALALQESLQLDRMRNAERDTGPRTVPLDRIEGVTVKSHPWAEMIGDKKPAIEPLVELIPADQYYVRFKTTKALRAFLDFAESWGGSVLSEIETAGRDYGVREKIETQICLKSTWLSELLGPAVIDSFAITGADPYLREGSDFTIIFRLKAPPVFETAVGRFLAEARKARPDAQESTEEHEGMSIQVLRTPDSAVRCYRARFDDYCVYSNSLAGLRRVLDARAGRVPSLAKSLDFVYMRTLYPVESPQEDGFIFLSDPFIRALAGPRMRIAEKRRLEAVTSMEMVKNAALLYLWEHPGVATPDLQRLYDGGCLNPEHVETEPGDRITWDPTAFAARSERYGRLGCLTPLAELPIDQVTEKEKTAYELFRTRYQDYWRRYFDPIGIRVATGRDVALSVTILPLIDNSTYADMLDFFGGKPTRLDPAYASGPRVIHFAAHLNPQSRHLKELQNFMAAMMPGRQAFDFGWIGQRMEFWMEDSEALLPLLRDEKAAEAFKVPITAGIQVKNPLTLAGFLVGLQALVTTSAPNTVVFEPTEPYRDAAFTAIRQPKGRPSGDDEWKDVAIYYGVVGGYLYFSTSLDALHRLVDSVRDAGPPSQPSTNEAQPLTEGHMMLSITPANAKKSLPAIDYYLAGHAWTAEREHLCNLWLVARTVGLGSPNAPPPERVLGFKIESALGSTYRYDPAHDDVVSSVTGSRWGVWETHTLPETSPLGALLRSITELRAALEFTKDGLRTELTIQRNP